MNRQLTDFLKTASTDDATALTQAQAFTITSYRKIGGNEARQIFSMFGDLEKIEAGQTDPTVCQIIQGVDTTVGQLCKAVYSTIQNGQFATDPNTPDGKLNRDAADILQSNGCISAVGKATFFNAALVEEKPFENITLEDVEYHRQEVVDLTANNAFHHIDFNIANSARQDTRIVVEQRFGADNTDLTDWHPCGSVTVRYRQQPYKIQVGASPAAYRELRLVSPVTLGVSVA